MRHISLISVALCSVLYAGTANAQDAVSYESADVAESANIEDDAEESDSVAISGEFVIASSYFDTRLFNDRFTDKPVAQLEVVVDLGNGVYVAPYVFSGFDDPLNDEASEYGVEIGIEREVGNDFTINVASGRYANYGGAGFGTGDWFARVGASYEGASISVTGLSGDSDTFVLSADYEAVVAEGFTLTPSVALITSTVALNFALTAEVELPRGFALRGSVVMPETTTGREAYAAAALVLRF